MISSLLERVIHLSMLSQKDMSKIITQQNILVYK